VVFLRRVAPATFEDLIKDRYFLDRYDRIMREFDTYMKARDTWFSRNYPQNLNDEMAYFRLNTACTNP